MNRRTLLRRGLVALVALPFLGIKRATAQTVEVSGHQATDAKVLEHLRFYLRQGAIIKATDLTKPIMLTQPDGTVYGNLTICGSRMNWAPPDPSPIKWGRGSRRFSLDPK